MNLQKHFNYTKKSKENIFSNVIKIIDFFYNENFPSILKEEKTKFLNKIETQIIDLLIHQYKGNEIQYKKELLLYEKNKDSIKSRYESDFLLLNTEYKNYKKFRNKVLYLKKYRKHCVYSEQIPLHRCSPNKYGKLIEVFRNNNNCKNKNRCISSNKGINEKNTSFVICTECSTCYMNSFIKIYCPSCKCDYYSSKLEENENENILPATWKDYHCNPIIVNEMMKCVKCDNILFINLLTKKLVCLNKKCNFTSNPFNIIWKCKICKKDFRSTAKVFNPTESKILQNEVWKCLLYKIPAFPKKNVCCLENEKNGDVKYYHDKKCKGELYKWAVEGKDIIVCGLCHAVNFYEKFIWTCPICNMRFNYHGKIYKNDETDKNLILKNNSKVNLKSSFIQNNNSENKLNSEKKTIVEVENSSSTKNKRPVHRHNYSTNIKLFDTDEITNNNNYGLIDKKLIYDNNFSIQSIEASNTIDFNRNISNLRNEDEGQKKPVIKNNNIPYPKYSKKKKKVKYQTLFDILEEREKYKINNQSRDENINNENLTNAKMKLDEYYNKKRTKLLEQSKPKTSMKKEKKSLFQKYFISNEKKNILINNLINKKTLIQIKQLDNNIINISDTDERQFFDENNLYEYESIKKNLQKKLSGDLHNFSSEIIGTPPKSKNSDIISNFKDKLYSKRYKDDKSTITNEDIEKNETKSYSRKKDILDKNQSLRYKVNIDKKKCYLRESNNNIQNISDKKNSEKNIVRNIPNNYNKKLNKYTPKCYKSNHTKDKFNNKYNVTKDKIKKEIFIDDDNEIKYDEEKQKNKKKKLYMENYNSDKWKKNQILQRVYLNKIRQNSKDKKQEEQEGIFNDNDIPFNNLITDFNNNMEMRISPLGDLGKDIVSKDDFLKVAKECKIPTFNENNIIYLNPIGQGSYGVIYLVEDKTTKKQYALKRVLCQDIDQILKHKEEFELCFSLNHPNIIKIYNVLFKYLDLTTYSLYVLMEKGETDWNSEIERRIKVQNFYKESELINILKQLTSVLYFFQKNNMAHRDIKPQNIIICKNNIYKITDLGEAKNAKNYSQLATLKGSQLFMSPNLFFVLKYDGNGVKVKHNIFKSDVFSLGYCFLYAMSLDLRLIKCLREETSMIDVFAILKRFGIENKYSEKFMNIIYKMIQTDENKRCDFIELNEEINKSF